MPIPRRKAASVRRTGNQLLLGTALVYAVIADTRRSRLAKGPSHTPNWGLPGLTPVTDWTAQSQVATRVTGPLSIVVERGRRRVISVLLVERCIRVCRLRRAYGITVLSLWPFAANVGLWATLPDYAAVAPGAHIWFLALAGLNALMLYAAHHAWSLLARAAPDVEMMMRRDGQESLARYVRRAESLGLQFMASGIGIAVVFAMMIEISAQVTAAGVPLAHTSYLAVSWTVLIGVNVCYWLTVMGLFPLLIGRQLEMKLLTYAPAHTPGIVRLVEGYKFSLGMLFAGSVGAQAMALAIPSRDESDIVAALTIAFPVAAAAIAIAVGIIPFYTLRRAVRGRRYQLAYSSLDQAERETYRSSHRAESLRERAVALMEAPDLPVGRNVVVQFVAATVASLVPFIIGLTFL